MRLKTKNFQRDLNHNNNSNINNFKKIHQLKK